MKANCQYKTFKTMSRSKSRAKSCRYTLKLLIVYDFNKILWYVNRHINAPQKNETSWKSSQNPQISSDVPRWVIKYKTERIHKKP